MSGAIIDVKECSVPILYSALALHCWGKWNPMRERVAPVFLIICTWDCSHKLKADRIFLHFCSDVHFCLSQIWFIVLLDPFFGFCRISFHTGCHCFLLVNILPVPIEVTCVKWWCRFTQSVCLEWPSEPLNCVWTWPVFELLSVYLADFNLQ